MPVAPLVGAWIEIVSAISIAVLSLSLLSWERGLKFCDCSACRCSVLVAPLVGAWIEIYQSLTDPAHTRSLLSWERGLKFWKLRKRHLCDWSLLSWERGLKSRLRKAHRGLPSRSSRGSVDWNRNIGDYHKIQEIVAPLVGAWIEIYVNMYKTETKYVAPLVGAWIEIIYHVTKHNV